MKFYVKEIIPSDEEVGCVVEDVHGIRAFLKAPPLKPRTSQYEIRCMKCQRQQGDPSVFLEVAIGACARRNEGDEFICECSAERRVAA